MRNALALSLFVGISMLSAFAFSASNQSVVYQGRIIRPDGSVLNSGIVSFTLKVYSPLPSKCLLYSETQSLDMNGSVGMFSLALGAGSRTDGLSHAFNKIFVNGGSLTGLTCANGSTSYAPASTDDRMLEATFNDGGTVVNLSSMQIKSIPFALQAAEIGGFGVNDIVKIHPTTGSATTFTTAEMAVAKTITGLSCAVNEVIKWSGTAWACSSDATGGSPSDASYLAKGIVQFDTNAATSGLTVASGVVKLSDVNSNVGTYGSATKTVTLTVNAQGRITAASHQDITIPASQITQSSAANGEVLKWNGTNWAPAADEGTTTDASYAAKGIVQFDTNAATSGISVASGVAKVNFGTGANQIVKLDGSGKLPVLDGSALTNISASSVSSGTLPSGSGGTGLSTYTTGDMLYATGASALGKLGIGANGTVLTSTGSAPQWSTIGSLGFIVDGGNTFTADANIGTNSNHKLTIETNGSPRMTFDTSGFVGIGTTTPITKLHTRTTSFGPYAAGTILAGVSVENDIAGNVNGNFSAIQLHTHTTSGVNSYGALTLIQPDYTSTNSELAIQLRNTAGTYGEMMRVTSAGFVGIGTATPADMLNVVSPGAASLQMPVRVQNNNSTNGAAAGIAFKNGTSANDALYKAAIAFERTASNGRGVLRFLNSNADNTNNVALAHAAMSIDYTGNVGIGNGDPDSILDITGAFTQRGMAAPAVSAAGQGRIYFSTADNKFKVSQNGAAYVDLVNTSTGGVTGVTAGTGLLVGTTAGGTISTTGTLNINAGTGANQIVQLNGSGQLPGLDGSALTNLNAANFTSGVLPINRGGTNNGSLGVTAGGILYMDGSKAMTTAAGTSGQALISAAAGAPAFGTLGVVGGGTGLTAGTSGGIPYYSATNTMASSALLTQYGVVLGGGAGAAPTATVAGAANEVLRVPSGGGAPVFGAIDLSQSAAVTGALTVANGGTGTNVTFGANALVVANGTGSALTSMTCATGQILKWNSTSWGCVADSFSEDASYSLSAGTNALANNITTSLYNVALGYQAQKNMQPAAGNSSNISLGYQALMGSSTVANNTGNHNFAAGYNAMANLTSGTNSVAIGNGALIQATSGGLNVGIGNSALANVGASSGNVAIGHGAQRYMSPTANGYNISFGVQAMSGSTTPANNTGINNFAVGYQTLYALTSGGNNVAIGSKALTGLTTGSDNFALGVNSGDAMTSAANNITIGNSSMGSTTTGSSNIALGNSALFSNLTGTHNIAVGSSAQSNMQTAASSYNIALGYEALQGSATPANNTGTNNFASGFRSMHSLTTGSHNVAIGSAALLGVTTGSSNFAFGWTALTANTTGEQNFAAGRNAMFSNTSGANNIAIGRDALYYSTVASHSIALGYAAQSQMRAPAGESNISFGYQALQGSSTVANNTGKNNFAVGYQSMQNATNGESNMAVGVQSLHNNSTGNNNLAIGAWSLLYNTTGNNNLALGWQALNSNETASNNIALGSGALMNNKISNVNIAIGLNAQQRMAVDNGSDGGNIAIGREAIRGSPTPANNTGTWNVGIGDWVLQNVTTASYNVAIGNNSLQNSTTGGYNIAIGNNPLVANTTGGANVGIGEGTMLAQTTASYNVGVGAGSLASNITSQGNTSIGAWSQEIMFSTNGYNTALGDSALRGSTTEANNTGFYNTAVGASALYAISGGSHNTAIGKNAGDGSNTVTTGNNNTFLGAYTGFSTSTQRSYATAIGSNALVGADSTVVLGRATDDKVAIGADGSGNSTYKFHVTTDGTRTAIGGTVAWSTTSDARFKTNVAPISDALWIITNLEGVRFDWDHDKYPNRFGRERQIGFIAQQVEKHVPEIVTTDDKGFKAVQYSQLVAVLTEALKELYAKFQAKTGEHDVQIRELASELQKKDIELKKREMEIQMMKSYLCGKDPQAAFCQ